MKISPNIMQAQPMWSNSLYFHNGCSIGKRNDSKTAHVHFRRILTANRDMSVIKAKLASDQQLGPTPAVRLKSKWQRKWDELQDTVTPHQMVDMQLARRIFRLNIWKWEKVRIAEGSCLRSVFIWVPMWNSARLRHFFLRDIFCLWQAVCFFCCLW